jgi:hypothetical protein
MELLEEVEAVKKLNKHIYIYNEFLFCGDAGSVLAGSAQVFYSP